MNFNNRHLICALKIKEFGTLSQAAHQIHLTQSALTQGINKLEDTLGHKLFVRTHAGMLTTQLGERFLLRVSRAFDQLTEFSRILFGQDKAKRSTFIRSVTSRQLRALIHIVELQNYTAAARQLGLSQPTLHRSMKDLEQMCEQRLLQRSPTGMEPNWCAKQFRRYARLFFAELQQGVEEINETIGQMNGTLRVGSLPLARTDIVPLAVLQLNDEFPNVHISIMDGPYDKQLNSLLHGQLDLIVGALRSPNQEIIQVPLFQDQLSIVVKAGHSLATRQEISANELQQLRWVAPTKSTPARMVFSEFFIKHGLEPPSHLIECSSLMAIRGILLNSERAALLPARQVEVEVRAGLLAVCPVSLPNTERNIGLTMRRNWHPTKIQRHFITLLEQKYSRTDPTTLTDI